MWVVVGCWGSELGAWMWRKKKMGWAVGMVGVEDWGVGVNFALGFGLGAVWSLWFLVWVVGELRQYKIQNSEGAKSTEVIEEIDLKRSKASKNKSSAALKVEKRNEKKMFLDVVFQITHWKMFKAAKEHDQRDLLEEHQEDNGRKMEVEKIKDETLSSVAQAPLKYVLD
ncbi:hypothetical protein Tco_1490786 [Tanacetum coccineum]